MRILPRFAHRPLMSVQAPAPQPEHGLKKVVHAVEEELADAVSLAAKIPVLNKLGLKLYAKLSKPKGDNPVIENEGTVTPRLLRGAQPTAAGFQTLRDQGVNTVINLRPEAPQEAATVRGLGMKYVYLPLPPVGQPTIDQAKQFLSLVTDPANGKVFFHCQHGADRTGAMAAAYRIAVQGWTAAQAIAEMPQYGFHAGLEDNKIEFIQKFATYWQGLDSKSKAAILHTSLNKTA